MSEDYDPMLHAGKFIFAFGFAALTGVGVAYGDDTNSPTAGPFFLTPDELQTRVVGNALRLQDEIRGLGVDTAGIVQGVEERYVKSAKVPIVKLKTSKPFLPVFAHLSPEQRSAAAKIDPGQHIKIRCVDIELAAGAVVNLVECKLAD